MAAPLRDGNIHLTPILVGSVAVIGRDRSVRCARRLNVGKPRKLRRDRARFLLADRAAGQPPGLLLLRAFGEGAVVDQRRELVDPFLLLILSAAFSFRSRGCFGCFSGFGGRCGFGSEISVVCDDRNRNIPDGEPFVQFCTDVDTGVMQLSKLRLILLRHGYAAHGLFREPVGIIAKADDKAVQIRRVDVR